MIHKDTPISLVDGSLKSANDLQPIDKLVSIYGTTSIISKNYEVKRLRRIGIENYPTFIYCCSDQQFLVKTEDGFAHQAPVEGDEIICLLNRELNHTMITKRVYEVLDTTPLELVKLNLKGDSVILIDGFVIIKP